MTSSPAYRLPTEVGDRRFPPAARLTLCIVLLLTSLVASQLLASWLRYNPSLGHGVITPMGRLYAPWMWIAFAWTIWNPMTGVNPLTRVAYYPAQAYAAVWALRYVLGVGALVAFVGMFVVREVWGRRVGNVEEVADSARWATRADLEREGFFRRAGPVIGGFETKNGAVIPLRYDGQNGIDHVAVPGDDKSTGLKTNFLIPLEREGAPEMTDDERLADFWGREPSIVALDVKGNLVASSSKYQAERLSKEVFVFEPLAEETEGRASFNPLWSIRIGTDHEADDAFKTALDIVDFEGKGTPTYWDRACTAFGAAIIATLGYRALQSNNPELLSLPSLVAYISSHRSRSGDSETDVPAADAIDVLIEDMLLPHDPKFVFGWVAPDGNPTPMRAWIESAALAMAAKASEERSGVYGSFIETLGIYRSDILRKHISSSTFSFHEIANRPRPAVVYLNIPAMKLDQYRPFIRIFFRTAIRDLTAKTGSVAGREVRGNLRSTVIALDEVSTLRHDDELASASGYLRGHGVMLMLLWQSHEQLLRHYGEHESITATMGVHIFGRPESPKDADLLSKSLGKFSTVVTKRNTSGNRLAPGPLGHLNVNADITTRDLLTSLEVRRLDRRCNIIFARGLTILARKFPYYQNPWLEKRAAMGRVNGSDVMSTTPFFVEELERRIGVEKVGLLRAPTAIAHEKKKRPIRVAVDYCATPDEAFAKAGAHGF